MIAHNFCGGRALRIALGIIMLVLMLAGIGMVQAEIGLPNIPSETGFPDPLQMPGRLEANGMHFELNNSEYLNITLDSTEHINLILESVPEMVTMYIEYASGPSSAQITISGFLPLTTYHKYEDDYHNHTAFTTEANGSYTYTQDLSKKHLVFIQPRPSTRFIRDDATGGDCTQFGKWDVINKTCTITADLTETIQIDSNGITLDGNGHTLTGSNTGSGIYLSGRKGVTIKNLNVRQFINGIYIYYSSNNILSGNNASNNNLAMHLYSSSNNTLSSNNASNNIGGGISMWYSSNNSLSSSNVSNNNGDGIRLALGNNNTLTNNIMNGNKYNFGVYLDFDNQIDTSNLVDGKPIYYIKGASNKVYDFSTNAGTFYCINCINVTIKNLDLNKNGYGIVFRNTSQSRIQNVNVSNNGVGISLSDSSNNTLTRNNANSNNYGIRLSGTNTLNGNNASNNNDAGIFLDHSYNTILSSNEASNNHGNGIYLEDSNDNTLSGNNASNNHGDGIYLDDSNDNTLSGNIALNNGYHGIDLESSSNNTLINNIMNGNKYNFGSYLDLNNQIDTSNLVDGKPVYYLKGASNRVYDSSTNAGTFVCINCINVTIKDVDLNRNDYGVVFWNTSQSRIQNVNTSNNYYGIYLEDSSNNTISDNNANSNDNYGIYLESSSNNTLSGNNASNNEEGIYIQWFSNNNTLIGNNASNNYYEGIYLYSSSSNVFYHNNLIDNKIYNAYDIGINQWDNGSKGNYYSDYKGTDSNSDGIGDTPNPIQGGSSVDRYPLMAPYTGELPTPVNQAPSQPTELNQFKSDETTPIATGTATNEKTVIFKGKISDPDGDKVKLQIELRRTDEYGGEFDETKGGLKESDLVTSGSMAKTSAIELIDSNYHWRARAVDEKGKAGEWLEFGENLVSDADFVVATTPTTSITVTSPNGGENWQAGTTQNIQWSYTGNSGSDVKIEIQKSGAVVQTFTTIPIGSSGIGSYNWIIPSDQTTGTDYRIRITSTTNSAYTDTSDGYFVISASQAIISTFGNSNRNVLLSFEPINMGTGSYIYQYQDIFIPGRGLPLTISRSYNSMDTFNGSFGSGWTFNYNVNLAVTGSGDVVVMREDGRRDTYILNPDGNYSPPLSVFDNLIKSPDGTYILERKDQIKYDFTPEGKLLNIIDKNENHLSFIYTGDYLTKVTDASGRELIFTYDTAGRIISITDPMGRIWSYAYDDMGNLVQVSDPMGRQFSYTYDENHWMTSIKDPRGNQIMTNTYDSGGRVVSQSNALGSIYAYNYDVVNRKTTETDPFGRTRIYAYDEHFWGLSETDQLGNKISYAYDEKGNRNSVTNANGQTTEFAYNANGDISQITDPLSQTTSMTYDSKDNPISITDALGRHMFLNYDTDSNLIKIINVLGNATVFAYDGYGQIISGTDAKGNAANFVYDTFGNQKTVTDALGNTMAFTYDSVGRLIEITDPDSNKYKLTYDDLDRLISITDPLGHTASNTYDAAGNRISFTDPAGKVTTYSYNSLNKLVTVTDALGGTVRYNYDAIGNKVSMTDANGHTTNYVYDPLNRPASIIDPLGYTASNTYDAAGNRISFTDAAGKLTKYNYDPLNRLVKVTDAMGGSMYYTYDAVGNMMSMKDANDHTTNYFYDPLNRPVSIIDPLGNTTSSNYDAVGNIISSTDANGKTTSYNYDGLNRLTKIVYPDGKTVSYGYDARGNRLMMADSQGTTNYQYDELNRLLGVLNPGGQNVGYKYDAVGNRIQITYPDNKITSYAYDATNRLTGVTDRNGGITSNTYDPNGNLIGMTYPNNMKAEYVYDEDNRLVELINKNNTQIVSSFKYSMDAVGNRLSVDEKFSGRFDEVTQTTKYEYDNLYRLTKVNYPFDKIVKYNYDPMGNRISMTSTIDGNDFTVNYVYDAADRLLQSGEVIYSYDNNGNLLKKIENPGRVMAYGYDGANRLNNISTLFGSERYIYNFEYDGDGNRISKTITHGKSTQSSKYLLDVNSMLPQVLTESNNKYTTIYTYGKDLISMTDPQRGDFYYHHDGLGSVRSMSDSKESVKTIYLYDAFGQMQKEMGHVDNDFQFTGEQMDDETGLMYLRARYYDPSVGRFISKDPFTGFISNTQSLNRYSYVRNNPTNHIDPLGLCDTQQFVDNLLYIGASIVTATTETVIEKSVKYTWEYMSLPIKGIFGNFGIVPSVMKRGIPQIGGWNFVKNVGPNLVGGYITEVLLRDYYSSGGQYEVRDVPVLSNIPFVGPFFVGVRGAGEIIDEEGNVYVGGKFEYNLYNPTLTVP